MLAEEALELFEKYDNDEKNQFDKLTNPISTRQDLCAFIVLDKLLKNKTIDIIQGANHDIVYLCSIDDICEDITEEDIQVLDACGLFVEADEYLAMFC